MKKKNVWPIISVLGVCVGFLAGFFYGFALANSIETIEFAIEPGVGTVVYALPELSDLMNPSRELLNERLYEPWEPAVIIEERGMNIVRVHFCDDGYEKRINRKWFVTYRLNNKSASLEHCEGG